MNLFKARSQFPQRSGVEIKFLLDPFNFKKSRLDMAK